jgi:hypothetical protein
MDQKQSTQRPCGERRAHRRLAEPKTFSCAAYTPHFNERIERHEKIQVEAFEAHGVSAVVLLASASSQGRRN